MENGPSAAHATCLTEEEGRRTTQRWEVISISAEVSLMNGLNLTSVTVTDKPIDLLKTP